MKQYNSLEEEQKHQGRKLRFLVPVDAGSILPENLREWRDRANYLLDLIRYQCEQREYDENGYARLKFAYLRQFIPASVLPDIREAIIGAGVIMHDPYYLPEEFAPDGKGISMGYRFTPQYGDTPLRWVECTDDGFAKRVADHRSDGVFHQIRLPVHKHLREWVKRVEVDVRGAKQAVTNSERLFPDRSIHHHAIDRLDAIDDPQNLTFCYSRYGRVFSNVTNLPREIRPYLRIGAEPLVSVDVRNCQPLLLCLIKQRKNKTSGRKKDKQTKKESKPSTDATSERFSFEGIDNTEVMDFATEPSQISCSYQKLCEGGGFYEHMMGLLGTGDRDKVKTTAYHYLFGPTTFRSRFADVFEREFPEIAGTVRTMKRGGYERVARALQEIESDLMIHTACKHIMQSDPSIPLVTIHDAVMTTPAHVETVTAAIRDAFATRGLSPSFKQETAVAAMVA